MATRWGQRTVAYHPLLLCVHVLSLSTLTFRIFLVWWHWFLSRLSRWMSLSWWRKKDGRQDAAIKLNVWLLFTAIDKRKNCGETETRLIIFTWKCLFLTFKCLWYNLIFKNEIYKHVLQRGKDLIYCTQWKRIKCKKDHRSYRRNFCSWEKKAWKNSGLYGIRTFDLCD